MFLLDGCAILQAVYMRYGNDDDDGKMFIKNDLLTFVYLDQFLLENQLPFRVLELLTSQRENGEKIHECNPKVHRRYCYQPRRGQGNRLFKEGKFELAREKYENVSNVMLDMITSRKIKRNLMHWLSQTFSPAKGNYKGTSNSRSGGIGENKRRT
ncbi:hypothetical protein ES332_A11G263400v1 [Gossypium tomentosum]|uniref:Uncharacterized protein n=1 Tax=Gossypium tomentosum TaxID=34277 RepID=A0A5D2NEW8_GOSTO|nr:hypothetical protein ES332_A11G263400v1 [Gossypium tomentosum]